jgi:hypothetical protein
MLLNVSHRRRPVSFYIQVLHDIQDIILQLSANAQFRCIGPGDALLVEPASGAGASDGCVLSTIRNAQIHVGLLVLKGGLVVQIPSSTQQRWQSSNRITALRNPTS